MDAYCLLLYHSPQEIPFLGTFRRKRSKTCVRTCIAKGFRPSLIMAVGGDCLATAPSVGHSEAGGSPTVIELVSDGVGWPDQASGPGSASIMSRSLLSSHRNSCCLAFDKAPPRGQSPGPQPSGLFDAQGAFSHSACTARAQRTVRPPNAWVADRLYKVRVASKAGNHITGLLQSLGLVTLYF